LTTYDSSFTKFVHVDFNEFSAGTILDNQVEGIHFSSTKHDPARAMIFDSTSDTPTGNDWDLLDTENHGLGKMVIYSEDGDISDR